jgi:3-isopropylmalate/(R)-2-methylmalate dehydratase small subunit
VPAEPQTLEAAALVVAGKHFGQSSGRAIAVKALRATGVGCVVGETFARTFYCNAFEVGLPVLEFRGVTELVSDGDVLTVDVSAGTFRNETTGAERQVPPPDGLLLEMLRAGGLIALAKARRDLFDPDAARRCGNNSCTQLSGLSVDGYGGVHADRVVLGVLVVRDR